MNSFYGYDGTGRLKSLIHSTATTAPSPGNWGSGRSRRLPVRLRRSQPDHVDQLAARRQQRDFDYDYTNQLTAADHTGQADEAYAFDENGNRTMSGYSAGPNNQLLTTASITTATTPKATASAGRTSKPARLRPTPGIIATA